MTAGNRTTPPDVVDVFSSLSIELIDLHQRWGIYRRVFDHDEESVDLLNIINGHFFGYTQWSMYQDVILTLCRYTDPAESSRRIGHRPNLTLERLVNLVTADDATFGSGLAANEWAAVKNHRDAYFEEFRSKRIAHNDFEKMMAQFNRQPAEWPDRDQVEKFLTLCTRLMEKVYEKFTGSKYNYGLHATQGEKAGEELVKALTEFSMRHIADVEAGRAQWMIIPPKEWRKRLTSM